MTLYLFLATHKIRQQISLKDLMTLIWMSLSHVSEGNR